MPHPLDPELAEGLEPFSKQARRIRYGMRQEGKQLKHIGKLEKKLESRPYRALGSMRHRGAPERSSDSPMRRFRGK